MRESGSDRQPTATGELGLPAGNTDQSTRNITAIYLQPGKEYFHFLCLSPPVQRSRSLELHLKQGFVLGTPRKLPLPRELSHHTQESPPNLLIFICWDTKPRGWFSVALPVSVTTDFPRGDITQSSGRGPHIPGERHIPLESLLPSFVAFGFPSLPKPQAQVKPQAPKCLELGWSQKQIIDI